MEEIKEVTSKSRLKALFQDVDSPQIGFYFSPGRVPTNPQNKQSKCLRIKSVVLVWQIAT